jgi:MTH538 TIR-like domain (DUF1863)
MARNVYFSFHYQRDIMRVQVVKQHYVTRGNYIAAGYFDGSLEERAKREGDEAVKRLIDKGMIGSSVTCVLIGKETYTRRWVHYEIFKGIELGMGVFGIRIHQIADPKQGKDASGNYPFYYLGYGESGDKLRPMIRYSEGWKNAPYLQPISRSTAPYLPSTGTLVLNTIFTVYDWVDDDGYNNFSSWAEKAARQAGR